MSDEMMVQCELHRNEESGATVVLVTWLPERFAVINKILKLKEDDGSWTNGWCVMSVANSSKMKSSILNDRSQDYKRTRKASDI
jgi:hypothetical protein